MQNMIHKFKIKDLNIVLDVNSGGVHVVDDLTYDMVDMVTPPFSDKCPDDIVERLAVYDEDEIRECYAELKSLYDDKILYSEDDYEKYAKTAIASPIKSMCLNISHDCNLRCKYCFAATGDFGKGRKLMPLETGKAAIDFLIKSSVGRQNLELDFFGGEPLMNFKVVKELVAYGKEQAAAHNKNIRFTITTNGMLLNDENIDFINKEMSNVVLSIDGRKEINDKLRVKVDQTGCYDIIVKNYKKLVERRGDKEYYVRGTFTKYNLDFVEDVLSLYREGFDQVSVEPVITDPSEPYAITEDDLDTIYAEYEKLADEIMAIRERGEFINFFHFMIDLNQGPCVIKRLRGCGCGNEYVAITPDGDIYPCHQFVGEDNFKMGNVHEGTFDLDMKKEFAGAHVYSKPECKKCWAKFYCSGGCNANNYTFSGDIHNAYALSCKLEKKRLECAIMMKVKQMMETAE